MKKSGEEEVWETEGGKEGRATAWGLLVITVWTQSGSRPPVSERLTGQMDGQISMLTTERG